ncbi:MAG: ABC transporter permease [Hydrogenibacillus schlegelii]|uniref:ABC transporter permease n=1 Tax=Hydrogenibacillus schlegelii TaxID=1484 RepID=A0A947GAP5_HYDSH|nr:ABC transporter permease [Hydrogenibacillus schlegelii]MBT9283110.1 ABC transporter permease [Hydrogenibacillus schlegelii]
MLRYLLQEIKRAVVSFPFLLGILFSLTGMVVWSLSEMMLVQGKSALHWFLYMHDGFLALLAPVIATLPFAQSYAVERNSGFSRLVLQRLPLVQYKIAKLLSNALAGGLVLALPLIAVIVWLTTKYPLHLADPNGDPPFFNNLPSPVPIVHIGLVIGLAFLFGATYATVGLAGSVLFRNPYFANVIPFAFYVILGFLLGLSGYSYLEPSLMWRPSNNSYATPFTVLGQYLVLWFVSLGVYLRFFRSRED